MIVRKLSSGSRHVFGRLFQGGGQLRFLSAGGAFIGIGIIMLFSVLFDKLRASALRSYAFVDNNFDLAGRSWKRHSDLEESVLRKYIWPVYRLAMHARDIHPPYQDEASFMAIATAALDDDRSLLEGANCHGRPVRIPFREVQRLFNAPPLSLEKNSINDLRFSHYRDLRDSHLGWRRWWVGLTQSSPFENYMLMGLRREVVTMISRTLRRTQTEVRLEDILGTADPAYVDDALAAERDDIRAYVAQKIFLRKQCGRERTFRVLEDGLRNVVKEVVMADPFFLTGEAYRVREGGGYDLVRFGGCLVETLRGLHQEFAPGNYRVDVDLGRLEVLRDEARELNRVFLQFAREQDPDGTAITDVGDLRATRMALQLDQALRKRFLKRTPEDVPALVQALGAIARRQSVYDRALLELRIVCASCFADLEFYARFFEENFEAYARRKPAVDYDPWHAKILPGARTRVKRVWRFLRQKLQRR